MPPQTDERDGPLTARAVRRGQVCAHNTIRKYSRVRRMAAVVRRPIDGGRWPTVAGNAVLMGTSAGGYRGTRPVRCPEVPETEKTARDRSAGASAEADDRERV